MLWILYTVGMLIAAFICIATHQPTKKLWIIAIITFWPVYMIVVAIDCIIIFTIIFTFLMLNMMGLL